MVQAPTKPPTWQITDEAFRQFLRGYEGLVLWELIDGYLSAMGEPGGQHQDVCSELQFWFEMAIRQQQRPLNVHPRTLCHLAEGNYRRPDLIVVDRQMWQRNTSTEVVLEEPPELVAEIVSTNWRDDYVDKAKWYAMFGVKEYWIADLLLKVGQYPHHKHPDIGEPTLSVGTLKDGAYQWQRFTGDRPIESSLVPELELTVEKILQAIG